MSHSTYSEWQFFNNFLERNGFKIILIECKNVIIQFKNYMIFLDILLITFCIGLRRGGAWWYNHHQAYLYFVTLIFDKEENVYIYCIIIIIIYILQFENIQIYGKRNERSYYYNIYVGKLDESPSLIGSLLVMSQQIIDSSHHFYI